MHFEISVRLPGDGRRRVEHVAEFQTTVRGLLALRDWLEAHRVERVAMESTGVYWKPVTPRWKAASSPAGQRAAHQGGAGRKTDVKDARGSAGCWRPGCCTRASSRPPRCARRHALTRGRRARFASGPARGEPDPQGLLEAAIKLDSVASDVPGQTGRAMLAGHLGRGARTRAARRARRAAAREAGGAGGGAAGPLRGQRGSWADAAGAGRVQRSSRSPRAGGRSRGAGPRSRRRWSC